MISPLTQIAADFRPEAIAGKSLASLSAGATSGLGLLASQVAFATFIFSGALAPYTSQGVGLVLFGNFAAGMIMAMSSGYRGVIAGLSPALVVGMAAFGSSMTIEGDALFVTVSGALILSAVVTGVGCLALGRFRLAHMLRFIPYPVSAGFVAGIGGAVCLAAVSLMGVEAHWRTIPDLVEPAALWRWGPGVAYGVLLYLAIRRWRNALILPVSVAVVAGGYHLALAGLGLSGDEARASGLLLTSTAEGDLWPVLSLADVLRVDWTALGAEIPNMLALIVVAFICVILNIAGLEVAANVELDWDREFQAGGVASTVAGLGGGTVATVVVPASLRSKMFGADTRLTGIVSALVIGVALFFGDGMLQYVPATLVAGVLVFAGLGMLDEGLVRTLGRLPVSEFSIIVLIFVAIIGFGLLEGVGVGVLATLVFFVVRLSGVNPIEAHFTAREQHSSKARSVPERAILADEGDRVHAYRLRGYVFFGSASALADRLKEPLNEPAQPDCLLLDFENVSGFDYSAVNVLSRVLQAANGAGVRVVLCAPTEALRTGLARNLPQPVFAELIVAANADAGLERCEEIVIAAWKADADAGGQRSVLLERAADDLEHQLDRQVEFEDLMEELREWLEDRNYARGDTIGDASGADAGMELLVSGQASARDAAGSRLHQYAIGDVVWPPGAREEELAAVVAEEPSKTKLLTAAARQGVEANRPELALKLYRHVVAESFRNMP